MQSRIKAITNYLLPLLVTAGDYALEVQRRIQIQPIKAEFSDPGSQILTDADLSIQNFIEMALLARYPDLKFYGEEYKQSLNQKYFTGGDLEIWLDPIDGTLRYKNAHPQFSIVASFIVKGSYQSCIWYMPALGTFSLGDCWSGIHKLTRNELAQNQAPTPYRLNTTSNRVLSYRPEEELVQKLKDFEVFDLALYNNTESPGANPMALSEFSAIVSTNPGVIDFLVAAKFLEWGGGVCTSLNGNPITDVDVYRGPSYLAGVLAASTPDLHRRLLSVLS